MSECVQGKACHSVCYDFASVGVMTRAKESLIIEDQFGIRMMTVFNSNLRA